MRLSDTPVGEALSEEHTGLEKAGWTYFHTSSCHCASAGEKRHTGLSHPVDNDEVAGSFVKLAVFCKSCACQG